MELAELSRRSISKALSRILLEGGYGATGVIEIIYEEAKSDRVGQHRPHG